MAKRTKRLEIIHDANDYARAFNRMAEAAGYDIPMPLIVRLISLFEQAIKQR